ncbi:MAG: hypothetical protein WCK89_12105 [bacterium]
MLFETKKGGMAFVCAVLFTGAAAAQQVEMTLTLAYNVFVVGEPVLVQLEALNTTRDLLDIGGKDSRDTLIVEITKGGQYNELAPFNDQPVIGMFQLKPGQVFQQKVELDKWFPVVEEGQYIVRFVIVHDGIRYESAKKSFDVVPGMPVKDGVQMFIKRQSQKRLFKLVFWHRNQTDRLFLRIEDDPSGKVWDSLDLGTLLQSSEPKIDISPEGVVTVLHRATQDAYIRTVLWSLPDVVEVVERNNLVDPEISASQRVKSLYGEMADGGADKTKKPWWKFW